MRIFAVQTGCPFRYTAAMEPIRSKRRSLATAVAVAAFAAIALALAVRFGLAPDGRENSEFGFEFEPLTLDLHDPSATRVGELEHLGGLALRSPDPRFGGLSGLLILDEGARFLAVSDRGFWVGGALLYDGRALAGAAAGFVVPMRDARGRALRGLGADAEGLARRPGVDDTLWVSFEHRHRIVRYTGMGVPLAPPTEVVVAPAFAGLADVEANAGLEAILFLDDGSLLAITEATRDRDGHSIGWLRSDRGDEPLRLRIEEHWGLTDIALLPGGDVLTLERWFQRPRDLRIRLRRIPRDQLRGAALLDGRIVAEFGSDHAMDNMEGLDVRLSEDGRVLVYMVSDDNYNPQQRTILHLFELKPDG